jgi:hypothetical protein
MHKNCDMVQNFCLHTFNRYLKVCIKTNFISPYPKTFSTTRLSAGDSFVGSLGFEVDFLKVVTIYTTSRKLIENKYCSVYQLYAGQIK